MKEKKLKDYNKLSNPKVIFVTLLFLCTTALALSFYFWNRINQFPYISEKSDNTGLKYNIDFCKSSSDSLFIKGWIFDEFYPKSGKLIITSTAGSKEFMLPLFTFAREDVSKFFSRTDSFDKVGFSASINKKLVDYKGNEKFNFYIIDNNGKVNKVLSYECKQ